MTDSPPDFLGIGAQKSGTTWLHRVLAHHDQVWMPPEKELHFFDERRYTAGLNAWRRMRGSNAAAARWRRHRTRMWRYLKQGRVSPSLLVWYLRYFGTSSDSDWYRSLFKPAGKRLCGEITPEYSALSLEEVEWTREIIGQTKIILFLRNPIERVWSQAQMIQRSGGAAGTDAVDVALRDKTRDLSDYRRMVKYWSATFGDDQLFVGQMEDIAFAPRRLIDALCAFLNIDIPSKYPVANRIVHRGGHQTIDTDVAVRLAKVFLDELEAMAESWGGWSRWWLFTARELLDNPPANSTLNYPFWDTELWERWKRSEYGGVVSSLCSGPLTEAHKWADWERACVVAA